MTDELTYFWKLNFLSHSFLLANGKYDEIFIDKKYFLAMQLQKKKTLKKYTNYTTYCLGHF